jgi:catechol 2,3-dioxygenase-like lactoylglutathione lyase family enzyme
MPTLNHLAIMCRDPERLSGFYCKWFGFEELSRTNGGSIYITDGWFNVGLLKQGASDTEEPNQTVGLHHVGFHIESIDDLAKQLAEFDPRRQIKERPKGGYAEYRIFDTEGIPIDLSEEGYGTKGEQRVPGIRHVAQAVWDTDRKFEFYSKVFGMRQVRRTDEEIQGHMDVWERAEDVGVIGGEDQDSADFRQRYFARTPNNFGGDGFMNLALLQVAREEHRGACIDHFGVLVREPYELMHRIAQVEPIEIFQRPPDRFAEYHIHDPEGNGLDLSEKKGYKVDVGKHARIEA